MGQHAKMLSSASLFQLLCPKYALISENVCVLKNLRHIVGEVSVSVFPPSETTPFPEEPRRVELKF